jgi:Tol biopolymer transport system component
MSLAPGTRLGPYEITAPLGAGGMGEVFRARDTRLGRDVAVKVLPRHLSATPEVRARFEREAKTVSGLNHPHICTLHDVGREGDTDYLVMELVEGETLAERLAKGALPTAEVLELGGQIADALDRAHRAGVIHRDLKPGNVMLTKSGAKLMDFGLARATGMAGPAGGSGVAMATVTHSPTMATPLTAEGTIVGTFQYMAPEQLEESEADARSDLWALGCVLYEMATARRAFEGKSQASLISSIMGSQPAPISQVAPMSPPGLEQLVQACLAKDPADRLQSAHDIRMQLTWLAEGGSQAGVPAPVAVRRRSRERLAWMLAAVLAVVATAAAWVAWREVSEPERLYKFNVVPKGIEPVFSGEATTCLTISPDGNWITFVARDEDGRSVLWLRRLDEIEPRAIDGSVNPTSPFWSPDSRHVAFFSGGKLKKASVTGTPPLNLCDVLNNPRAGSWNKDGVIIFSLSSLDVIYRVPAAGGTPEPLTELDESKGETTHRWATFLPDGNHFLYMSGSHTTGLQDEGNAIYVSSLDNPKERKLVFLARSNAFHALGHLLYVRDKVLVAQKFDDKKLEVVGDPFPVVDGVTYSQNHFRSLFSVAENGMLVYYPGSVGEPVEVVRLDRDGNEVAQIGESAFFRRLGVSPDGRRIAMAIEDPSTGYSDIWIHDIERNVRSRFTFGPLDEDFPLWSPDGAMLYFNVNENVQPYIYRKSLTGTAAEEAVVKGDGWKAPVGISADGRRLAYTVIELSATSNADILTLDLESGGEPTPFLTDPYSEFGGRFSPDGSKMLYVTNATGRNETYVATFPVPERRWQISNNGGWPLGWTSDGKEILFVSSGEVVSVKVDDTRNDLVIGAPVVLFDSSRYENLRMTRDGQAFYATKLPPDTGTGTITFISDWMAVAKPEGR